LKNSDYLKPRKCHWVITVDDTNVMMDENENKYCSTQGSFNRIRK